MGASMTVPLKAVYRDLTVGIRYLHPLDDTNTTVCIYLTLLFSPFINPTLTLSGGFFFFIHAI